MDNIRTHPSSNRLLQSCITGAFNFEYIFLFQMPLDGRAGLHLGLLLLVVPAQYFITSYIPTDEATRSSAIRK